MKLMSEYSKWVPGVVFERRSERAADAFGFVGRGEAPGVFEADVGWQAGVVGQELTNRYILFAVRSEVRKVLRNGVVELQLARLVELHDGGRSGEALAERGHVEDRVFGHGLGWRSLPSSPEFARDLAVPVGLLEDLWPSWSMRTTAPGSFFAAIA